MPDGTLRVEGRDKYLLPGLAEVADDITLVSTDCVPDQIARMSKPADNYREICHGYASLQAGWGAVDELNRPFQGLPPGNDHVGIQLFTSDTIGQVKDPNIGYDADGLDYRKAYLESWGLAPASPGPS